MAQKFWNFYPKEMHASKRKPNTHRHIGAPTHMDTFSLHENNISIGVIYSPLYGLLVHSGCIEKEKAIDQATPQQEQRTSRWCLQHLHWLFWLEDCRKHHVIWVNSDIKIYCGLIKTMRPTTLQRTNRRNDRKQIVTAMGTNFVKQQIWSLLQQIRKQKTE